ncbi:uncharacterized protein LOC122851771 [Aphidius gifuensis]|uniref:uncharacterized protein LOC122851771 n=1 Tax=Aphidius gifuensis TaxID=684658 RepID=UPI001CDCF906|nr:uncharacterized protein LOC122851771 [Aphidius gifuensis]
MSKIVILPLLIISQLNLKNDLWHFGPEITYNVTYNANTALNQSNNNWKNSKLNYEMKTQLKCRPRTLKILNCHIEKPVVSFDHANKSISSENICGEDIDRQNFEIRFNRFGIKELIVSSNIKPYILDTIRAIVNQLNAGVDLTVRTNGTYRTWENFTTGDCFTFYDVKLSGDNLEKKKNDGEGFKWRSDVSTLITKIRDVKKCRINAPYFLGSREAWRDTPQVLINIKSSKTVMSANRTAFISTTKTSIELENLHKKSPTSIIYMNETMTLKYISVKPSNNQITRIQEPACTSVITGKWLHDDLSVENDVNEQKKYNITSKSSLASLMFNFDN